ncbi:MAG: 1-acyl-sn-glycerol-3-phosphate acyltransferase [Chloroflexi bacterium]|nr:1-acyl-sn-glycerol-3-phosphate acyltransferase [Chloroflexota bacterium]
MSPSWRERQAPRPAPIRGGRRLRAAGRAGLLAAATGLAYPPMQLSRRMPGPATAWRGFREGTFRAWSRLFLDLARVEVELVGQPPRPPFFLVGNHLSYIDIALLGAHLPGAVFVAQHGMASWPVFGALARSLDTIFVDRGDSRDLRRVNAEVSTALSAGRNVVLFPEGTSTPGLRVERFLSPVLEPAVSAGIPVSCCSIAYRTPPGEPPAHEALCWWGDMGFVDHALAMLALPGFRARLVFGETAIREADRKVLARRLQAAVGQIFTPTVEGAAACRLDLP